MPQTLATKPSYPCRADGWHDIGSGPGCAEGKYINWLTIKTQAQSVLEDVERLRLHPLVPANIPIYGYIYQEVPEATAAGKAA